MFTLKRSATRTQRSPGDDRRMMGLRLKIGWGVQLALLAGLPAFAQGGQHPAAGTAEAQGQRVFAANCAGCHGGDGSGSSKGPAIATDPSIVALSDDALLRIVHEGVPGKGMPPFPALGDEGTQAVVRFLRTLQGVSTPVTTVENAHGDPEAGRNVYFGKGQCSTCHMLSGQGGFIASDLTAYSQGHDPKGILNAIVHPDTQVSPDSRIAQVQTKDGKKLTGAVRYEDNINLGLQTEDGRYHFLSRLNLAEVKYNDHSLMPTDYGTRLTAKELDDLVSFLIVTGKNAPAELAPPKRGRRAAN